MSLTATIRTFPFYLPAVLLESFKQQKNTRFPINVPHPLRSTCFIWSQVMGEFGSYRDPYTHDEVWVSDSQADRLANTLHPRSSLGQRREKDKIVPDRNVLSTQCSIIMVCMHYLWILENFIFSQLYSYASDFAT